ncbi:unnamed protein product [Owenia fusiformis]|uniref:Pescadillo homolog n=1 Tax=Owenia fusiformis TaxID=6347 RepID=A0A8J1TLQ8_OWEFU|nr:unnamed protein product [Owenia fusiformis]
MGKEKKKYESGAATAYISRSQALRKLQLSLADFRRLCIIKGIYPHEPRHKKTVGKGSTAPKTYYYLKDIQFLLHEPIVNKFRDFKSFLRKIKRACDKGDDERAERLRQNKPKYKLDHIVKERYPTFIDAIRDMDDCLSMAFLFSTFPKSRKTHVELINRCKIQTVEFMHYIISSKSLRKVFISIKGVYYQAEVMGQIITWVAPHKYAYDHPTDVDYKIMSTFVEFYTTMLGFINYRLYTSLSLHYPPKLELPGSIDTSIGEKEMCSEQDALTEKLAALTQTLQMMGDAPDDPQPDEFPAILSDDPDLIEKAKVEQENMKKFQQLFKGLKFFLNREVPRECLTFIIRSFGGVVSWEKSLAVGSTYSEDDETITHHIVDRPSMSNQYLSRFYIQPQWVFDSVNAHRLLPVEEYFIGADLPPHLSPFVEETEGVYAPPEQLGVETTDSGIDNAESSDEEEDVEQDEEDGEEGESEEGEDEEDEEFGDEDEDDDEEEEDEIKERLGKRKLEEDKSSAKKRMSVEAGQMESVDVEKRLKKQTDEERKLAEMMIPKKNKRLYNKIVYKKKKMAQEAKILTEKRADYDKKQRKSKRKQKAE